ncbi:MAG: 2OG-Fe(II) oxygenase [Cystobacter sp.]
MLDLQTFAKTSLQHQPYTWSGVPHSLQESSLPALVESYPSQGFVEAKKEGAADSKQYHFEVRHLVVKDQVQEGVKALSPVWQALINELRSPAYRETMQRLSGLDLSAHVLDIGFFQFQRGHWVAPHTDHLTKSLTHVFYFNPHWEQDWGGALRILNGKDSHAVHRELPPRQGHSAVIVRSDHSWHMVTPVASAAQWPRRTLQVEFWKQPSQPASPPHAG